MGKGRFLRQAPGGRRAGALTGALTGAALALLAGLAGCGQPDRAGAPYRGDHYSSQEGSYRTTGGSEHDAAPFSNSHSQWRDTDDGQGNGMTTSRTTSRSQFP
ncbi:MAG: hypothetical protein ACREJ2_04680 [Planctomycetota bacterium]